MEEIYLISEIYNRTKINKLALQEIVLATIDRFGGVCEMLDIYSAVDSELNKYGLSLSKEAKDSLRGIINKAYVNKQLVMPFDRSNPGWRRYEKEEINPNEVRNFTGENLVGGDRVKKGFSFKSGYKEYTNKSVRKTSATEKEITHLHVTLQKKLYEKLVSEFGESAVGTEQAIDGKSIDVVLSHRENEFSLYEIKTNSSCRQCIREALGQLLEYAYYYTTLNIRNLVVVSHHKPNDEDTTYLSKISKMIGVSISHLQIETT